MRERFPEVFALSPEAKLQLFEELWDDVLATSDDLPLTNSQIKELFRRHKDHKNNPELAMTWDQVKQMILDRHSSNENPKP